MKSIELVAQALTSKGFAAYGNVIEAGAMDRHPMNAARFERFDNLCIPDTPNAGKTAVSIARCRVPTALPYRISMVERHPRGSQAFVPLGPARFVVVVAPAGESVDVDDLQAFVTNGRQGINYHLGTWHMPLIGFETGQSFLLIERAVDGPNCDEHHFDETVTLAAYS